MRYRYNPPPLIPDGPWGRASPLDIEERKKYHQLTFGAGNEIVYKGPKSIPVEIAIGVLAPLYHVTAVSTLIMEEGFKTREELGKSIMGGGPSNAVSFTQDLEIAKQIKDCLGILIDIANDDLLWVELKEDIIDSYGLWEKVAPEKSRSPVVGLCAEIPKDLELGFEDDYWDRYYRSTAYRRFLSIGNSEGLFLDPIIMAHIDNFVGLDTFEVGIIEAQLPNAIFINNARLRQPPLPENAFTYVFGLDEYRVYHPENLEIRSII